MSTPTYRVAKYLKAIDLLVQTVLIILLVALVIDGDSIGWLSILFLVGSWHMLGAFIHIFPFWPGKLSSERGLYWVGVIIFFIAAAVIWNMRDGDGHELAENISLTFAGGLGLWYYTICVRELIRL